MTSLTSAEHEMHQIPSDESPKKEFLTPKKVEVIIDTMVAKEDMSYIDALLEFADDHEIEYEDINKLVTPSLKTKIQQSAIELGFFARKSTLTFCEENEDIPLDNTQTV